MTNFHVNLTVEFIADVKACDEEDALKRLKNRIETGTLDTGAGVKNIKMKRWWGTAENGISKAERRETKC